MKRINNHDADIKTDVCAHILYQNDTPHQKGSIDLTIAPIAQISKYTFRTSNFGSA